MRFIPDPVAAISAILDPFGDGAILSSTGSAVTSFGLDW
jgi:hypothetical protein